MKTVVETVAPPAPMEAYAVENRESYGVYTPEMTEFALTQLEAGVQTREGGRKLEGILHSL